MAPADTRTLIDHDLPCVGCDYNLRTQPTDGACPECGMSVGATRRFPRLGRSAPRWLTSLVDSVTMLLVAFGFSALGVWLDRGRDEPLPALLGTAAWALAWFALWLLTRPEPGDRRRAGRGRAWALRLLATPPYVAAFGSLYVRRSFEPWADFILAALLVPVAPATFLYYDFLCDAAHRLPNKRLAWQAAAVSLSLPPALLASIVGIAWLDRWPRDATRLLTMLPMTGLGGVGDLMTTAHILRARTTLFDPLPLTLAPAAVMTVFALGVLLQSRIAFAAAARATAANSDERNAPSSPPGSG